MIVMITYGQLTHITYPGSLGGESFVNSSFGRRDQSYRCDADLSRLSTTTTAVN